MKQAFANVWGVSTQYKISMRIAAYVFALEKLAKAIRSRGSY
jgi:glutamate dehydrogenase/leucine dehydrogenase